MTRIFSIASVVLLASSLCALHEVSAQPPETVSGVPQESASWVPINLSGHWRGYWEDFRSGHSGPLKGDFCRLDASRYQVKFRGRFFKIIPFRYSVILHVVGEEDGKLLLSGQSYLGRRQGTFYYQGWASDTQFVANFHSCKYQGRFVLSRCGTCY